MLGLTMKTAAGSTSAPSHVHCRHPAGKSVYAYSLQMSVKLTKPVFLAPRRTTWGGFMVNRFFSPAAMSGLFCPMRENTRVSSCKPAGQQRFAWRLKVSCPNNSSTRQHPYPSVLVDLAFRLIFRVGSSSTVRV